MRSVILMAFKNIKKKKLQSTLIAIIIGVSALILSTGIGLAQSFDAPAEEMFKETNASHNVLYINEGLYNMDEVKSWLASHPNIEGVSSFKAYNLITKISLHGKKLDKSLRIAERPILVQHQDKLLVIEGENKNAPNVGEIWIPTSIAYDNDLKVGEEIQLPTKSGNKVLKISAIVVDPVSSSSLIGTINVWVASGEIERIFNDKYNTEIVGLKFKDLGKSEKTWGEFEKFLKAPFGGYRFGYEELKDCYNVFLKISGAVLIAFSFIVIICAIFIIAFTISNSILGDYKVIGILKSQGFNSRQIRLSYVLQFFMLSIVSIPIGTALSFLCIKVIMSKLLKAIGTNNINTSMLYPVLIASLTIIVIIISAVLISSKKISKIRPSEALKAVSSEVIKFSTNSISLTNTKFLTPSFSLAVKQIWTYKRQVVFIAITLLLTSFVFSGTVNSYNSILKLGDNIAYWGFDNSDATIQFRNDWDNELKDDVFQQIKNDKRISSIVQWSWSQAAYKTQYESSKIIEVIAYDGNMDSIGIVNIKGRNPITLDEVSLSINTSKDMKKDIGDNVELYFKGYKKSFIVTSIYQSMVDGGTGVRLQRKAIEKYFSRRDESMYAIKLEKGVDSEIFVRDISNKYKDVDIKKTPEVFQGYIASIVDNMAYALMLLLIIFTVITFIIIFNVTLITIYQQKKDLGILKAIGMTNSQIRSSIIYKMMMSSITGIIIGVPAGIIFMPKLMNLILEGIGMQKFPFVVTKSGTLVVSMLSVVIVYLSTRAATRRILDIKLNSLIND